MTGYLFYVGIFLVGVATFIVAYTIFSEEEKFKTSEQLDDADAKAGPQKDHGIILRYSRPFFKRYFSPAVAGMKYKKTIREKYRRKLANGGLTQDLTPEDFFAFKLFLIIGFPILFLVVREFGEFRDWPLIITPLTSVVGFFYPNLWLSGLIANRKEDVIHAMPFVVDMLALSVEAGLDFIAAITKVVEKAPTSPLINEFEIMIKEIKLGSSRGEALRALAWRIDVLQITSFSATLIAADSVGASIGPILKTLANEMRQKKSAEAEKKGAQAATKMLFPMLFLIVPAVMLVIAAPLALQFIMGG